LQAQQSGSDIRECHAGHVPRHLSPGGYVQVSVIVVVAPGNLRSGYSGVAIRERLPGRMPVSDGHTQSDDY